MSRASQISHLVKVMIILGLKVFAMPKTAMAASNSETGPFTIDELKARISGGRCAVGEVTLLNRKLRATAADSSDLLGSCPIDCGVRGCTYQIYLAEMGTSLYHYAGLVDGQIRVTQKVSHGYYDLTAGSKLGDDLVSTMVLKYDGKVYRR